MQEKAGRYIVTAFLWQRPPGIPQTALSRAQVSSRNMSPCLYSSAGMTFEPQPQWNWGDWPVRPSHQPCAYLSKQQRWRWGSALLASRSWPAGNPTQQMQNQILCMLWDNFHLVPCFIIFVLEAFFLTLKLPINWRTNAGWRVMNWKSTIGGFFGGKGRPLRTALGCCLGILLGHDALCLSCPCTKYF